MKPLSVLIDIRAYPEGSDRTGLLTVTHEPELLPDGWVRFKTRDGQWHKIPPSMVLRVSEAVVAQPVQPATPKQQVEVPYLVSKRKPKPVT